MKNFEEIQQTQQECCEHYSSNYTPTELEQLVVISDGIYEGAVPVEGVRYPSPSHMTGWWLTTDNYNGDVDTLQSVHFRHIVEKRPELAIYMGLKPGYRFLLGGKDEHVWFDEKVANDFME